VNDRLNSLQGLSFALRIRGLEKTREHEAKMRLTTSRFLPILAFTLAGCGGNTLGQIGEVLGQAAGVPAGAAQTGQLTAEIRSVDTQRRLIQVATQDGQTGSVQYDQNTVVVYQQQQHPVTALERGDIVVMQVQQTQNAMYTSRIDVQQSVQDRQGTGSTGTGSIMQFNGRVAQINHNEGWFVLQAQNGNVTVALPYNPPQATLNYFHSLRVGSTVRLEATSAGSGRFQIHRFL
jgi:hypothetical protein